MFKYIQRSAAEVAQSSAKAIRMDGLQGWKKELPLLTLNTKQDINQWAIGCDKDIGGFSEASLELTSQGKGKFSGNISLELPANREIVQSGYAAIRSKERDATMWGTPCWDTSLFRYLALRVRGDNRKYFVNIQTDTYFQTDLFQHRLFLRTPGQWETVMVPFRDFVFTSNGMIMPDQVEMFREKIKTIGISLTDRQEGPFSIEIDWIKAMNSEDTEGDNDRTPTSSEID